MQLYANQSKRPTQLRCSDMHKYPEISRVPLGRIPNVKPYFEKRGKANIEGVQTSNFSVNEELFGASNRKLA